MLAMLFSLLLPFSAQGNLLNGKAILPHCQQLNIEIPAGCRDRLPPGDLAAILPVADKLVKAKQVSDAQESVHRAALSELDASIRARTAMLECLDKPTDPDCAMRKTAFVKTLENTVKRLRIALAFPPLAGSVSDRSIDTHIQAPSALANTQLPPLSPDELAYATKFQASTLEALEAMGMEKILGERKLSLTRAQLLDRCKMQDPDLLEACVQVKIVHEQSLDQFRRSMNKVATSLVNRLPIALLFRNVPVTDAELRKQLTFSRETLEDWRNELGKSDRDLLASQLSLADDYAGAHPEACSAIEANILHSQRMNALKEVGKISRNATMLGLACAVGSPLVCYGTGSALGGMGLGHDAKEWSVVRQRLASSDPNGSLVNQKQVKNQYRDLLVTAAFAAAGTVTAIKDIAKGGGLSLELVADDVFDGADADLEETGEIFEKIAGETYGSFRDGAVTSIAQKATEDHNPKLTETYSNWLLSDSFTASLYKSFDAEMRLR